MPNSVGKDQGEISDSIRWIQTGFSLKWLVNTLRMINDLDMVNAGLSSAEIAVANSHGGGGRVRIAPRGTKTHFYARIVQDT